MHYSFRQKEIGRRIREEREKKGWSIKEFLDKLSMSPTSYKSVKKWENGEVFPSVDALSLMAEAFDCDIGYLLCDYNDRKWVNANVQKETGLSIASVDKLIEWKNGEYANYPHKLKSLDVLLECDNFLLVLDDIADFAAEVQQLEDLLNRKVKNNAEFQKTGKTLLDQISRGIKDTNLHEYDISEKFRFILQEIRRRRSHHNQ